MVSNTPVSGRRKVLLALTANLVSFTLTLIGVEVALRIYHGKLLSLETLPPEPVQQLPMGRFDHDAVLGWVPKPGVWKSWDGGWVFTIDSNRLRTNGQAARRVGNPILTEGASFTFGDEVNDDETWPAWLEKTAGQPVLNAGVSAYGVDQAFLRAERLLEQHHPALIILGIVSDDVTRTELSFWNAWKPHFSVVGGDIKLMNVPVPQPGEEITAPFRRPLSYSHLAYSVLRRVAPEWWWRRVQVHSDGERVVQMLLRRLSVRTQEIDSHLLLVTFGDNTFQSRSASRLPDVVARAKAAGIDTLDLANEMERMRIRDPALVKSMFHPQGHYSSDLNRWVAQRIAGHLRESRTSARRS